MAKTAKMLFRRGIPVHADGIEYWAGQQKQLRRNLPRWNQFRSSLDAIRQTHRAIEAYNHSNGDLTEDQRYLAIYGLLQALVVQQDAMCHLSEALQTKPVHMNRHKRLEEIRNIRNWTVGHPTKIDRYNTHSHHAIQRPQLGRGGFSLYSAFDDGREQYTYVPLLQLARLQRQVVSRLLRDMLRELNSRQQSKKAVAPTVKPAATPPDTQRRSMRHQEPSGRVNSHGRSTPIDRGESNRRAATDNRVEADRRGIVDNRAGSDRRGATAHVSPVRKSWDAGPSRFESRRDGTPTQRQNRRYGTPTQKPPQFATPVLSRNGRNRRKAKLPKLGLLPLPGEKLARHRPVA